MPNALYDPKIRKFLDDPKVRREIEEAGHKAQYDPQTRSTETTIETNVGRLRIRIVKPGYTASA